MKLLQYPEHINIEKGTLWEGHILSIKEVPGRGSVICTSIGNCDSEIPYNSFRAAFIGKLVDLGDKLVNRNLSLLGGALCSTSGRSFSGEVGKIFGHETIEKSLLRFSRGNASILEKYLFPHGYDPNESWPIGTEYLVQLVEHLASRADGCCGYHAFGGLGIDDLIRMNKQYNYIYTGVQAALIADEELDSQDKAIGWPLEGFEAVKWLFMT